MTKQERKLILIGIGVVIAVLLILLVINIVNQKENQELGKTNTQEEQNVEKYVTKLEDNTKINNSEEFNRTKKYKNIEISNIQFTYENGRSVLLADVKNTSNVQHTSEVVKLIMLGENNEILDEINAVIPNMKAGETKKMNTIISGADSVNARDFRIEENK